MHSPLLEWYWRQAYIFGLSVLPSMRSKIYHFSAVKDKYEVIKFWDQKAKGTTDELYGSAKLGELLHCRPNYTQKYKYCIS